MMTLLSNKIRKHRFRNGEMTQKTLAERVGVSRQTMNAIENCHHAPTVSVAIRIADIFQVSVDRLFQLDYEGKPARREQPASATDEGQPAPIKKPVRKESRPEPVGEEVERQVTLADLRKVIGP